MADPYWRFGTGVPPERDTVPRSSFPGYVSSESSFLSSHHLWSSNDLRGPSDYLQKDILPLRPGAYSFHDIYGVGSHPGAGPVGLTTGASLQGLPVPLEDPALISQRRDVSLGIHPDFLNERPNYLRKADDVSAEESSMLFVDGLPKDCTRREAAHLFRPFIGFKDIRVVHKGARRAGDKAMVLCFVEFSDAKCALTAMDALQGYRFDDRKPDSPALKIQFAQFPFHLPSSQDDRRDRRQPSR
ncbi:RNA recognition motif domain [Macleaya cordata]|uniref:RNA recognition motif domain n=1 Tax=Macleaya cordata TaxID=56857 RepID=A0A200Q201_MACCD|nr:RNA recognition motif domain [Macleaya cordata]